MQITDNHCHNNGITVIYRLVNVIKQWLILKQSTNKLMTHHLTLVYDLCNLFVFCCIWKKYLFLKQNSITNVVRVMGIVSPLTIEISFKVAVQHLLDICHVIIFN